MTAVPSTPDAPSPSWQYVAVETTPDGLGILQDGRLVHCNPAMHRLLAPGAMVQDPATLLDGILADDRRSLLAHCRSLAMGAPSTLRTIFRTVDPTCAPCWFEATLSTMTWEGASAILFCARPLGERAAQAEAPACAYSAIRAGDVTLLSLYRELAAARESLEASERQYQELFENAPVGIFLTDSSGRALHVNPAMARMVGAASVAEATAQFQNLARQLYVNPDRRQEFLDLLARDGAVSNFEYEARRMNGERAWLSMNARIRERLPDGTTLIDGFTTEVTERKQAQLAVAESESRYRALFEDNAVVMALVDAESGVILDVNKAACTFYGWSREELLRMRSSDINLEPEATLQRERAAALCHGKRFFTFRHRLASGEIRDVEIYSGPIIIRGAPFLYSCILDITERVAAETALRKSQQRLRLIADTVPGVLYQLKRDRDGHYTFPYLSDRAQEILGVHPPDAALDAGVIFSRIHQEDAPEVIRLNEHSWATMTAFNHEHRYFRRDGVMRWIQTVSIPTQAEDGATLWNGIVMDITDRVLGEQELQQSRAQLLEAQRIAHMGRFAHNLHSGEGWWSEETLRIFGTPPDTAAPDFNAFIAGILAREDRAAFVAALDSLEESGGELDQDVRIHTNQGELRSLRIIASLEPDASGQPTQLRGVVQDVSDRARILDQLRKASREAEAASRVKSEFLANMSHEIRTPLNGVMGMLQLLMHSSLDAQQREHVETALAASSRLASLLSDILDISAVEAGKLRLTEHPFRLGEVLASVELLFGMFAREKGLTLRIESPATVPPVLWGDSLRLRQILYNLVNNALKFTETGGVTLQVHLLSGAHLSRTSLLFAVSDSGPGISAESLPHIFDTFFRDEHSHIRQVQGAGLGLPIVRQLATLMRGGVCVESWAGEGSTFYVSLPLQPVAELAGETPAAEPPAPADQTETPLPQAIVLVVEDEQVNRLMVRRLLELYGIRVLEAANGREALHLLSTAPVDLILMDIQMPVLDGLAATRAIRTGAAGPDKANIPIVALTAYALEEDRLRFLAAGMHDVLAKPVSLEDMLAVLRRNLAYTKAGHSEESPSE